MLSFSPEEFTETQVKMMRELIGDERALVAVSGGVDSTTCAVLTYKAIGDKLVCVILDDAFMRKGEPNRIAQLMGQPPINLPLKVLNVQKRFIKALEGLGDAEAKRKAFRETFYKVLGETAKKEECKVLVQGTIKADVVETQGGVKTQHNVLEQMGINTVKQYGFKVVEPLVSLYKEQVRMVARSLKIPSEIAERQPFPGPGLSVRVVGKIETGKLQSEKKATDILERNLKEYKPSQYFAAIIDNKIVPDPKAIHIQETAARRLNVPSRHVSVKVFEAKATGVVGGKRRYSGIVALKAQTIDGNLHRPSISRLVALQADITAHPSFTRILYLVDETPREEPYSIILRAIQTHDFLTAEVAGVPWTTLEKTAEQILKKCKNVSAVYYDVTPKPPATIEME